MSEENTITTTEREYLKRYKREIYEVELLMACSPNDLTTQNAREAFDHLKKALVLHISHSESLWNELQQMKTKDESRFRTNGEPYVVVSAKEVNEMREQKYNARDAYNRMRDELMAMRKRCDELIEQTKQGGGE